MLRILERAYLHRDKVAMISFRKTGAQILLAPTRSVELARRLVETLPAGGTTPLAAGLIKTLEIARQSRLAGVRNVALVLFTDGRANVAWAGGSIDEELRLLGAALQVNGISLTLVDTRLRFVSGGEAEKLARLIAARYLYLPRNDAASLAREIVRR
jgi:magnesium chelatase subunit D